MEITSLTMTAGVQSHVTVIDRNTGLPLPDGSITWATAGSGAPGLTISADPLGGFFLNATTPGTVLATATYHSGSVSVQGQPLAITIGAAVLLAYTSP